MQDEFTVTLDEEDFIAAYRPQPRPRRLTILVLMLALMIALLIVVLLVHFPDARSAFAESRLIAGLTGAVILAASLVILLLSAAPALRRRAARSTLEHHPGMRDPVHYAFDDEGFSVRTTYTQAGYPWGQIWDWQESDRVLLVLPSPRNFYVIPKRDVDTDVLERLRDHLGEVRKRVRGKRI